MANIVHFTDVIEIFSFLLIKIKYPKIFVQKFLTRILINCKYSDRTTYFIANMDFKINRHS